MYYDLFPGIPWEVAVDIEEGVYSQEEMVYVSDTESDSTVEEIDYEGSWANPIDLTSDTDDDYTDGEGESDDDDDLYLD